MHSEEQQMTTEQFLSLMPALKKKDAIALRDALEGAGVDFIPESGSGVRLRKGEP